MVIFIKSFSIRKEISGTLPLHQQRIHYRRPEKESSQLTLSCQKTLYWLPWDFALLNLSEDTMQNLTSILSLRENGTLDKRLRGRLNP